MPWDPFDRWPDERRWIWLTIAGWLLLLRGPAFIENLRLKLPLVPDFFQEYASARNALEGQPIYAAHHESVRRYLGLPLDDRRSLVVINAHPPTSVLFALPFARLDFADAILAWNLVSLAALVINIGIVWRQLFSSQKTGTGTSDYLGASPRFLWSLAPIITLLLLCFPLWEQCRLGQLTLIVLLLITGAWAAERSGRPKLAGALLGAAACVKLFPAFLFVYYALRRRWYLIVSGLLTIATLTAITAAVLGIEAYRSYFTDVLPAIQWFRVGWNNDSIWGFFSRLFAPAPEHTRDRSLTDPLLYSPLLTKTLSLTASAALVGILAWAVWLDKDGRKADLTFAMAVTAMLLISPICWEHYLLLLLAPLAIIWTRLPAQRSARAWFATVIVLFWMGYPITWTAFGLNGRTAMPVDAIGILSYQFYALLAFLALALLMVRQSEGQSALLRLDARRTWAVGAVVMAAVWIPVLHGIWRDYRYFAFIGGDFGIYRSIAAAVLAEGSGAMYDLDLVAPYARELVPYYGPVVHHFNLGPGPYPAVYIVPFLLLNFVSPVAGYWIWTAFGLALACLVARGMAARRPNGGWGLAAVSVLWFPIVMALIYGQLTMLFFYGFYRAYRSLEDEHDFRAGLWSGALYLKPQYVGFLFLVYLIKRRWRALGGLALAGLLVLIGSLMIVGVDGLWAQYATLRAMAGFRDVDPIVGPSWMINWRGLLVNVLPEDVSEQTGRLSTLALSILTLGVLPLVWRGEWAPREPRFAVQMLATVIVMMLASYHNHVHSAALLLVPSLALSERADERPRWLPLVLLTALLAPLPLFAATGSMLAVSWLVLASMFAALGAVLYEELAAVLMGRAMDPGVTAGARIV